MRTLVVMNVNTAPFGCPSRNCAILPAIDLVRRKYLHVSSNDDVNCGDFRAAVAMIARTCRESASRLSVRCASGAALRAGEADASYVGRTAVRLEQT